MICLVSNPPYIRTAKIEDLMDEVKFHDPVLARDGKEHEFYFLKGYHEQLGTSRTRVAICCTGIGCS